MRNTRETAKKYFMKGCIMSKFTMISEKTPKTRRPTEKKVYSLVSSLKKKPIVLAKGKKFTIGRLGKNSLPIREKTVSELHASIKWDVSAFKIKDENSTNGTLVNNKRISRVTILKHGDKIRFGKIVLKFSITKVREKKQEKPAKKKKAASRKSRTSRSKTRKLKTSRTRAKKRTSRKSTKRSANRRTIPAVTQIKWPLFD